MPAYEYNCSACELNSEHVVSFAKRDRVTCPHCGRKDFMTRLLAAPAIRYTYPAGHARNGRGGTGKATNG